MALNEGLSPIDGTYKTLADMQSRSIKNDRIIGLLDGRRYKTQATNNGQGLLLASANYAIPIDGLIAISGVASLDIELEYGVTSNGTLTLPVVTGIPLLSRLKITAMAAATLSTLTVDGTESEVIVKASDGSTSTLFNLDVVGTEFTFIFNGTNWEV